MTDHPPQQFDPSRERKKSSHQREPDLTSSDPYAVLGLSRHASMRQVKRAYFDLVRQYPPETQAKEFKLVRAAYEKLQTEAAKAETDLFLFQPPPPWEPRKRPGKLDLTFDPQDIWLLLQTYGDLGVTDFTADYRPVKI
ncbi:MAG: J domain-containing protein [Chloroflexi bacterium]|nr:J domain-containing protein [Chloroflexota bacterium]MBU1662432.1 J domain-containing protein [Chloroflexota bacterium]